MIVQSIRCDKCKKIILEKNSDEYFTIKGALRRGSIDYTGNISDAHLCVTCFLKHFNLSVSTPREYIPLKKQESILELIPPYRWGEGIHIPITCTDSYEVCSGKTCVKVSE